MAAVPAQLDHPLRRAGHGHATAPLESGGQARLGLELAVETGGVLHQAGPGLGRPQLAEEARRVPGRAARELALLEQDDVGPAQAGQVVRGRGPDDAAADDHDAGAVGQIAARRCMFHGRPFRAGPAQSARVTSARSRSRSGPPKVGLGPLVLLHPPRPEVEVDGARAVLDRRPQRPAVLRHQPPQAGPRQLVAPGRPRRRPSTSSSSCSSVRWHSLQMLPSSK